MSQKSDLKFCNCIKIGKDGKNVKNVKEHDVEFNKASGTCHTVQEEWKNSYCSCLEPVIPGSFLDLTIMDGKK